MLGRIVGFWALPAVICLPVSFVEPSLANPKTQDKTEKIDRITAKQKTGGIKNGRQTIAASV
jgi:hypothetical protein